MLIHRLFENQMKYVFKIKTGIASFKYVRTSYIKKKEYLLCVNLLHCIYVRRLFQKYRKSLKYQLQH